MKTPDKSKFPGLAPAAPVSADPDLYRRIGKRLADAREAKRLTQDELGSTIGESAISISRWETATRKPNIEDLEKLARALGKSIIYFTELKPIEDDDSLLVLNRAASDLDASDREELLALANFKIERMRRKRVESQMNDHKTSFPGES